MKLLSVNHISKSFDHKLVLNDISFEVEKESFVSIFGPNAAGKTTLLNIIAGLVNPTSGRIEWSNENLQNKISYVFQNYRETLFPWKNVWENITLPLKLLGATAKERKKRAIEILDRFSIELDIKKYPYQLSGGQQQLMAIIRAIITEPQLLLLDEPFSALDFQRRLYFQQKILEIWQEMKNTIIFISHDLDESIFLADKVILINKKPTQIVREEQIKIERPREVNILTEEKFILYRNSLLSILLQNEKVN